MYSKKSLVEVVDILTVHCRFPSLPIPALHLFALMLSCCSISTSRSTSLSIKSSEEILIYDLKVLLVPKDPSPA